jgi:hypothetical protein
MFDVEQPYEVAHAISKRAYKATMTALNRFGANGAFTSQSVR